MSMYAMNHCKQHGINNCHECSSRKTSSEQLAHSWIKERESKMTTEAKKGPDRYDLFGEYDHHIGIVKDGDYVKADAYDTAIELIKNIRSGISDGTWDEDTIRHSIIETLKELNEVVDE